MTFAGPVLLKIVKNNSGVLTEIAKIYSLTAFPEKKQPVEYLRYAQCQTGKYSPFGAYKPGIAQQTAVLDIW
jgi:hypothetical protein